MKQPGVSRLFNDTQSALNYCNHLLKSNGQCETMLPSTYRVWRVETNERCGAKTYESVVYTNPGDPTDHRSVLEVDFSHRQDYEETTHTHFKLFLWVILVTFY